jgi:hypothetical protein
LTAYEKFPEPREVEELKVTANKKELGATFKKDAKAIAEALEALPEDEAECLRKTLESGLFSMFCIYFLQGAACKFLLTFGVVTAVLWAKWFPLMQSTVLLPSGLCYWREAWHAYATPHFLLWICLHCSIRTLLFLVSSNWKHTDSVILCW